MTGCFEENLLRVLLLVWLFLFVSANLFRYDFSLKAGKPLCYNGGVRQVSIDELKPGGCFCQLYRNNSFGVP